MCCGLLTNLPFLGGISRRTSDDLLGLHPFENPCGFAGNCEKPKAPRADGGGDLWTGIAMRRAGHVVITRPISTYKPVYQVPHQCVMSCHLDRQSGAFRTPHIPGVVQKNIGGTKALVNTSLYASSHAPNNFGILHATQHPCKIRVDIFDIFIGLTNYETLTLSPCPQCRNCNH